jgi:class 3 adenylate cyclase
MVLKRKTIEKQHYIEGVALVVDINGSEKLIGAGEDGLAAQFFRDLLCGGIHAIEEHGGSVIAYTGDGFQAILPDEEAAAHASWDIARDLRKTREYLEHTRGDEPTTWPQLDIGVGLKIAMERGILEVSTISSDFLGDQPFLVGHPTVYASRLLAFGKGDRCLIGPIAAANWKYAGLEGPFIGKGKHQGSKYEYYLYNLDDLWTD